MKSKLFYLLVLVMFTVMSSCSNKDINGVEIGTGETVTYKFVAATEQSSVEVTPMSKSTTLDRKTIFYKFESGSEVHEGSVREGEPIYLELNNKKDYTFKLHSTPDNINKGKVQINSSDIYGVSGTVLKSDLNSTATKTLTLTRQIGQFTAKVGKIPNGSQLYFEIKYNDSITLPTFESHVMLNYVSGNLENEGDNTSFYCASGDRVVEINVSIVKNGHTIKSGKYFYNIIPNRKTTVTYNINNVNGDNETTEGDYVFDINTEWGNDIEGGQQVGKPQQTPKQ